MNNPKNRKKKFINIALGILIEIIFALGITFVCLIISWIIYNLYKK